MSVLSDRTIRDLCLEEPLLITPWRDELLQPASYDLTLGQIGDHWIPGGIYELQPKEFILCSTHEMVHLPDNIVGRMEGKSSLARKGLIIHTAGFVDPGFRGQLVLEVTNLSNNPIRLVPNMRICQIAFQYLDRPAQKPYGHTELGSHYQDQVGVVGSKIE